jgi:hypothetical protein
LNTFRHAGDLGDIIAALPAIRYLGGGVLLIEASTYTRQMLTPDKWLGLDKIIKEQPYISDVQEWKKTTANYNLNDFRTRLFKSVRMNMHKDKSLVDWQLEQYGIPLNAKDEAWIKIEPKKIARVVINRTGTGRSPHHVYHNQDFPWHWVWKKYRAESVFVGLPEEHEVFCATCGEIPRVHTRDLYEAAQVIAGCDMFIGNQSVCFWLAEAMKKRIILEVWKAGPNCLIFRDGVVHGWDRNVVLPEL